MAYSNSDGVRDRKLGLKQFLSEHGVVICLLNETHFKSGWALKFANYEYHRTDRPTPGGTAIFVHKGIGLYAVPVLGLQYLEATAIHIVLATRPVKLVSAHLSPTRPQIEADLTECLSEGIPILMEGDLKAKHTVWNSGLITATGTLLCDYAH
jgi:hypothetical protein